MVKAILSETPTTYSIHPTIMCIGRRGKNRKQFVWSIIIFFCWLSKYGRNQPNSVDSFHSIVTMKCTKIIQRICLYSQLICVCVCVCLAMVGIKHAPTCTRLMLVAYTKRQDVDRRRLQFVTVIFSFSVRLFLYIPFVLLATAVVSSAICVQHLSKHIIYTDTLMTMNAPHRVDISKRNIILYINPWNQKPFRRKSREKRKYTAE